MRVAEIKGEPASPTDADWNNAPSEKISLVPIPLDAQPNAYIRTAWAGREYGRTADASVAVAKSGKKLFVRLEWSGPNSGTNGSASNGPAPEFTDAAAVFFPVAGKGGGDAGDGGSPGTIGTRESPVRLWHWRDRLAVQENLPAASGLTSMGPGVFRLAGGDVNAQSSSKDGKWSVVISGEAAGDLDTARMGIAIWDGSNQERSGIGAVTPEWIHLKEGD